MHAVSCGEVLAANDATIEATVPGIDLGSRVRMQGGRRGVVIALREMRATIVPLDAPEGVRPGSTVRAAPHDESTTLGSALFGRSCNGHGDAIDGGTPIAGARSRLSFAAPLPQERVPIDRPLWCGVRAIDTLLTFGRGARIGILGGAGVGKTTLLDTIARGCAAEAVVYAAIGERGREAERAVARTDERTTTIVATGDARAAERVAAAEFAMAHAVHLRARGLHVLLLCDSLARYAGALRELALARGEMLGRGGWPPSVVPALARWLEAAGATRHGSITVVATVLAADSEDPLLDATRALLDGHIVLSPALAASGRFPAIDVLASRSRTMSAVVTREHAAAAERVREALFLLDRSADARALGILGEDPALLAAVTAETALRALLEQGPEDSDPGRSLRILAETADRVL